MKRLQIQLLVLPAILAGCAGGALKATAPTTPGADTRLTVRVDGIVDPKGTINVGLYQNADTWLTAEGVDFGKVVPVVKKGEVVSVVFDRVPAGIYAVSLFQDLDESRSLKRGPLGIPAEPWGMSNDATGVMGPPSFNDAALTVSAPETTIDITLRSGLGWPSEGVPPHHVD